MGEIVAHVIGAIIVAIALGFLARNAKFQADRTGHRMVLRYPTSARIFGWLLLCGGLGALYVGAQKSTEGPMSVSLVFGFFTGLTVALLLEFYLVRIEFDDYSIYTRSPWRPQRRIPWYEVMSYSFSVASQWYVFRTRSMGAIRLSVYLSGLGSFMAEAKRRQIIN